MVLASKTGKELCILEIFDSSLNTATKVTWFQWFSGSQETLELEVSILTQVYFLCDIIVSFVKS